MDGDAHGLAEISVEPAADYDRHHEMVEQAIEALRLRDRESELTGTSVLLRS